MLSCLCVGLTSVCYGFWLSPACQSLVYPLRSSRSPLPTETTGNHYLKSTNPSLFPSHKGAMCTFSILPANSRVCVCVCFKNASAVFFLHFLIYLLISKLFFPSSIFLFFFFSCASHWLQLGSRPSWRRKSGCSTCLTFPWTTSPPCLSFIMSLLLSLSHPQLIVHSYLHRLGSMLDMSFKAEANLPGPFDPA